MIICNLDESQKLIVIAAFNDGMRSESLENQPAPWMYYGLKILESGEELSSNIIEDINRSGGTDHPDPWFR